MQTVSLILTTYNSAANSIYDAMNQGYRLCAGEIVVFFNELFLMPDAVSRMVKGIEGIGR